MSDDFNGTFFLSITTAILTFCGVIFSYAYKSKCKECSICVGLIRVQRDVEIELKEDIVSKENESKV
jgi:hypothetical protein